jgi:hypothetical protein
MLDEFRAGELIAAPRLFCGWKSLKRALIDVFFV